MNQTLVFDEYDFNKTAELLVKINPAAPSSKDEMIAFMQSMAYQYLSDRDGHKSSYCGTLGFYLSAFDDIGDPTKRHIRANVSSNLVLEFLDDIKVHLEGIQKKL